MKKKEIDVKDVFYSAEYERKAEKINNTEVDVTNPEFEEKKDYIQKVLDKFKEEKEEKLKQEKEEKLKQEKEKKLKKEQEKKETEKKEEQKNLKIVKTSIDYGKFDEDGFYDDLIEDAMLCIAENKQASISMLQRKFCIGFSRAARIIDVLEENKLVSGYDSEDPKPREVYFEVEDIHDILREKNFFKKDFFEKIKN